MKLLRTEVILFIALLVMMMFIPIAGAAGDELKAGPLNPEFIQYMKEKPYDSQVQAGKHGLGLIPSLIYRPDVKDVRMFGSNGKDRYSATFDLRDSGKVSPVKDQNPWGTCWAFATFGSLESTSMPATSTPGFSEKNLVNLAGFAYEVPQDAGGQMRMSTAYLTRWNGPVNSVTDPYPTGTWTSSDNYPPVKHVQNVVFFPGRTSRTDNDNIKGALTRWGAVYSSLWWYDTFYSSTYTSYYQPASDPRSSSGHAVTIIGWDDAYPATNFNNAADGPGAWLVKNSWGSTWGSAGYFYVSYYDKAFGSAIQSSGTYKDTAVFLGESTSNYDTVYSYDKLGEVNDYSYGSTKTGSFANVFTATSSETIKAVGFYTTDLNVPYTVRIYKNPTSGPIGGTPVAILTGTLPLMGYNTVEIPSSQQVPVTTGDTFSVVVQVTNPTNTVYIPIEMNSEGYTSGIVSQYGQGYLLGSSGWVDLKTQLDNSHVCVKAYTGSTSSPPTVTLLSPASGTISGGTTVTISGTNLLGVTAVNFGSTAATTFTQGSATSMTAVSPAGTGIVNVTVTTSSGTSVPSTASEYTYTVTPTTTSTVGIFRNGVYYLASANQDGGGQITSFAFGDANDVPIAGVWSGSGSKTGLFRNGVFYLASANQDGGGQVTSFTFGAANDVPIVVDNKVGVFRNGVFYLASANQDGGGQVTSFVFGAANDVPIVVDNKVGVFRNGVFYLASANQDGGGQVTSFAFGAANDVPVVWHHDGKDTVGVFRNGVFYLTSANQDGGGQVTAFSFGAAGDKPVTGTWA
jgi:C1A family cysteine protease